MADAYPLPPPGAECRDYFLVRLGRLAHVFISLVLS